MDRHYLIDLALSIAQDAADEWHVKEELSGKETELKNIDKKEMPALYAKVKAEIEEIKQDYVDGAILRRAKTDILGAESPAYDYHKRCKFKHRATAYVQASEAYLAHPTPDLYNILVKSEERFYFALSQLMGVKAIENCGRCLSDELNNRQMAFDTIKKEES